MRHLVVGHVGDRGAAELDAVAVGAADVGHVAHRHLGVADDEVGVGHLVEAVVAAQVAPADREVRRPDEALERLGQRLVVLRRRVDVEAGAGPVGGGEERQALHVVEVQVGDEGVGGEGAVVRLGLAPVAEAGAQVEDDGLGARATRARRRTCCRRSAGSRRRGTASSPAPRRTSR